MNDDILWKIDSEIGKDKKVVELRKEIEDLTNSNNFWKRKCSEMGIALKTYEEGRYQEHLEIERLNKIIKKVNEILNNKRDKMIMQQFDCDFEELLYQIDEEIRDLLKEK